MKAVKTRVAIADDHDAIRAGLKAIVSFHDDMELVGSYLSGNDAIQKVADDMPDVLIMDIDMPGINGVDAIPHVLKQYKKTKVVLFTLHPPDIYAVKAFENGAYAYIGKDEELAKLIETVRTVAENRKVISNDISMILVERLHKKNTQLSTREAEVLQAFLEGMTNQEISNHLNISPKTVSTHKTAIMEKLAVKSDVELVMYAIKNGIKKI